MISCDIFSTRESDNTSTAEKSETANYSQWVVFRLINFKDLKRRERKCTFTGSAPIHGEVMKTLKPWSRLAIRRYYKCEPDTWKMLKSSGYVTDRAGIWYSQSVFNSESPKMYDYLRRSNSRKFCKIKRHRVRTRLKIFISYGKVTKYSIKKNFLQLYYNLTSPYRHLYHAKNPTFPTSTIRTPP